MARVPAMENHEMARCYCNKIYGQMCGSEGLQFLTVCFRGLSAYCRELLSLPPYRYDVAPLG